MKVVNDMLLFDYNIEGAFYQTSEYLSHSAKNGMILNKNKFQICQVEEQFGGLQIILSGVTSSENLLNVIINFLIPMNINNTKSWFGLVN